MVSVMYWTCLGLFWGLMMSARVILVKAYMTLVGSGHPSELDLCWLLVSADGWHGEVNLRV